MENPLRTPPDETIADPAKQRGLIAFLEGLKVEANDHRQHREGQATLNLNRYLGHQWDSVPPEGLQQYVVNLLQNAILGMAAVQVDKSPRPIFSAAETNEPPSYFLSEKAGRIISDAGDAGTLIIQGFSIGQLAGLEPLTEEQADQVELLMQPIPGPIDPVSGVPTQQPPMLEPDAMIAVNDESCADLLQEAFTTKWDWEDTDNVVLENVIDNAIVGWQDILVQWDADRHTFRFINPHQFNVWFDPISTGHVNAHYAIVDEIFSEDEAIRMHPGAAEDIKKNAGATRFSQNEYRLGAPYRETNFKRRMVRITTAWLRHSPLEPMSPDEAIEKGLVEMTEIPAGTPRDDEGQPIEGAEPVEGGIVDPETGAPMMEQSFVIVQTGALTDPEQDNWPMRTGVRQVQYVGTTLLQDMECPFVDMPIARNKNVPIPKTPYGQGEPDRLFPVQKLINTVYSAWANNAEYFQSPQEVLPESVANKLDDPETFAAPNRRYVLDDELFMRFNGNVSMVQDPPKIPESWANGLAQALEIFDKLSGYQDVVQGVSPDSDSSGKKVQLLQEAAKGLLAFKSRGLESCLRHAVKVAAYAMIDYMPESEWAKVTSHPIQVVRSMRTRIKNMEWDVVIEIASGRGANRESEHNKALALYDRQLLSRVSTLEKLDIDNAEDEDRKVNEQMAGQVGPQSDAAAAGTGQ